jgi:hypothetical protein
MMLGSGNTMEPATRVVEFFRQAAKQRLVVLGHAFCFHAQVSIVQAVVALALIQARTNFSGLLAASQFMASFNVLAWYSSFFSPASHQPGADMLGQHHDGFVVQQSLVPGFCK